VVIILGHQNAFQGIFFVSLFSLITREILQNENKAVERQKKENGRQLYFVITARKERRTFGYWRLAVQEFQTDQ